MFVGADLVSARYGIRIDSRGVEFPLGLSQDQFATVLHISVNTLQNWEQGRCVPDGPAQVLLRIADKNPKAVLEAIH